MDFRTFKKLFITEEELMRGADEATELNEVLKRLNEKEVNRVGASPDEMRRAHDWADLATQVVGHENPAIFKR